MAPKGLFSFLVTFIFFSLSPVCSLFAVSIGVEKPVCLSLKGSPNAALYMTICLPEDDVLTKVEAPSELADRVELHTHQEIKGIMKMIPLQEMKTDKQCLILERGGKHIMLMGVKRVLLPGDKIPLILYFEKAGLVKVNVPVESAGWKKEASTEKMCCHCSSE